MGRVTRLIFRRWQVLLLLWSPNPLPNGGRTATFLEVRKKRRPIAVISVSSLLTSYVVVSTSSIRRLLTILDLMGTCCVPVFLLRISSRVQRMPTTHVRRWHLHRHSVGNHVGQNEWRFGHHTASGSMRMSHLQAYCSNLQTFDLGHRFIRSVGRSRQRKSQSKFSIMR